MSDEVVRTEATDSDIGQATGFASWLPRSNRRWIIKYALAMTTVVNFVVNGLLAGVTTMAHRHVDLVAVPLVAPPNLVTDTLGTFVILPLTTSLLCSLGIRAYLRRGLIDPIRLPAVGVPHWLDRLPDGDVRAGIILAGWTTALLGPGACALLAALSSRGMDRGTFVLYKAVLGVALGAVITPMVALRAMSQRPLSSAPVLT